LEGTKRKLAAMRLFLLYVLILSAPVLAQSRPEQEAPAQQAVKPKTDTETAKPRNVETGHPNTPVAVGSHKEEIATQSEKHDREPDNEDRVYGVKIVAQPINLIPLAAVLVSIGSLLFVWQQIRNVRRSERAWLIISPLNWNPGINGARQ
jgi:hypothetical protein